VIFAPRRASPTIPRDVPAHQVNLLYLTGLTRTWSRLRFDGFDSACAEICTNIVELQYGAITDVNTIYSTICTVKESKESGFEVRGLETQLVV
jgi:hypothetical protein